MKKKKSLRLSNTAVDMYFTCPRKYKLHYLEKIRPTYIGSALVFGKAVDEALNVLLLQKKKKLTDEEKELVKKSPTQVFDEHFMRTTINSEKISTKGSDKIDYYKSDCDISTLLEEDIEELEMSEESLKEFYEDYNQLTKNKEPVSAEMREIFRDVCWHSLRRKGHMFIEAYERDIMPELEEVHSIQNFINLPNGQGDFLVGVVDFVATFKDGVRRIVDNKTSGSAYKPNAVETSQQLAIYSEHLENRKCSYVVLVKKLRKKDPRVRTQIIHGNISEELLDEVFDKVGELDYNIKSGNFPKKMDSCFQYGKKCPYYKYCRTGEIEGLKKL